MKKIYNKNIVDWLNIYSRKLHKHFLAPMKKLNGAEKNICGHI